MECLYGFLFAGALAIQTTVCLINSCYTCERIDKIERRLNNLSNAAALRIDRIERRNIPPSYYPPGPYIPPSEVSSAPLPSAPLPSAPLPSAPFPSAPLPSAPPSQPKYTEYSY